MFRFNNSSYRFYLFTIGRDGFYMLFSGQYQSDGSLSMKLIEHTHVSAIKTALGQSNLLAVVARGKNMHLYINQQYISLVNDGSSSEGMIGVVGLQWSGSGELAFRNAKVWEL